MYHQPPAEHRVTNHSVGHDTTYFRFASRSRFAFLRACFC